MKVFIQLLLFFFISFLSAPTIVVLVDREHDMSCFYDMEEEEEKEVSLKEINWIQESFSYTSLGMKLNAIVFFPIYSEDVNCNYTANILIPPPELLLYLS